MVVCPVVKEASDVLAKRLKKAKEAGLVSANVPLVIRSLTIEGSQKRAYHAVDDRGNVIIDVEPFLATPTICD